MADPKPIIAEMVAALQAARPHLQRIGSQRPTTEGRHKRMREAVKALTLLEAALAKADLAPSDPA